jgi:hypothetical protein
LSSEADRKKEGEQEAKAFEEEYSESHPDGPYQPLVITAKKK